MRTLLRWVGTAIAAQPFCAEEIQTAQIVLQAYRHRLPVLGHFPPN